MCGGGDRNETPPRPTAEEIARENVQAQIASLPQAAKAMFDVYSSPEYGMLPTTELFEQVRQSVFPGEQAVREQLQSNILDALVSPTGRTPQQEVAVQALRQKAKDDLTEALRTRANLGGKLFGGRAIAEESDALKDLEYQFAEADVTADERRRINALNAAIPFLQLLFPSVSITPPNFINPVPGADTAMSSATTARGQDISQQMQAEANRTALLSSLYQGLGRAGGAAMGYGGMFGQPI